MISIFREVEVDKCFLCLMKGPANRLLELNLMVQRNNPRSKLSFLITRFYLRIRITEIRAIITAHKDPNRLGETQGMETRQQLVEIVLVPVQLIGGKNKSLGSRATSTI